jgi:hypothetical protein
VRTHLHFRDWKRRDQVALSKGGRAGRARSLRKKSGQFGCCLRAPRDVFWRRRRPRGRFYRAARGHAFRRQGFAASITEAAKLKIDAYSSASGTASDRSLRRWASRTLLAPDLRSLPACLESDPFRSRTFGFLFSHRSSGSFSHELPRITLTSHPLNCLAWVPTQAPDRRRDHSMRAATRSDWGAASGHSFRAKGLVLLEWG